MRGVSDEFPTPHSCPGKPGACFPGIIVPLNSGWCWAGEVTVILPSHCICLLLWSWLIQALSCSFGFYNVLSQLDVQIVTCLCSACCVLSLIIDHCPSVNWCIEAVAMNKWDRRDPKQALHHVSEWTLSFKVTLIQNSFGNGLPLSFMTCVRNRFALCCNSGYINLNSFFSQLVNLCYFSKLIFKYFKKNIVLIFIVYVYMCVCILCVH